MSNNTNTNIMERAAEAMDYAVGTMWESQLELAIESNDLDQIALITAAVERHQNYHELMLDSEVY